MLKTIWQVQKEAPKSFLDKAPDEQRILWQILYNRGIQEQEIDRFMNPSGENLHDPSLMQDIDKASDIILASIAKKEKIIIHGDYDADGVVATVLIYETLKDLGANVDYYIPHREKDGYGININKVKEFSEKNDLLITVDCGVTNKEEVALARKNGMSVVVTDHHQIVGGIPDANAVVNPNREDDKYPFKGLSGAGVAFKLLQIIHKKTNSKSLDPFSFMDILSLATVGDCMDLVDENRVIVRKGMEQLKNSQRKGLSQLIRYAGVDLEKLNSYSLAFQIVPRLNAAGRMHHANTAFELLTEKDATRAQDLAYDLNKKNRERQKKVESLLELARQQAIENYADKPVIVAGGDDWPVGVVGLVAGKLTEEFGKPSFVYGSLGENFAGSARSIEGFHVTRALDETKDLLLKYGGHETAGGFTFEKNKLDELKTALESGVKKQIDEKIEIVKKIPVDKRMKLDEISTDLVRSFQLLEPFGLGNPEPRFVFEKVRMVDAKDVGRDGKHLKFKAVDDKLNGIDAIGFGLGEKAQMYSSSDSIDILGKIEINEWNGVERTQLKVDGIRRNK